MVGFMEAEAIPELTLVGMVLAGITVLFAIAIGLALLKYKDIKLAFTCHAMAGFATMLVVLVTLYYHP